MSLLRERFDSDSDELMQRFSSSLAIDARMLADGFLRHADRPVLLIRPEEGEDPPATPLDGFETWRRSPPRGKPCRENEAS